MARGRAAIASGGRAPLGPARRAIPKLICVIASHGPFSRAALKEDRREAPAGQWADQQLRHCSAALVILLAAAVLLPALLLLPMLLLVLRPLLLTDVPIKCETAAAAVAAAGHGREGLVDVGLSKDLALSNRGN